MDDNTIRKIIFDNSKRDYCHVIELMKDKAWKISQTGKKGERKKVAIELADNLDALREDIMSLIDGLYNHMDNI